MKSFSLISLCVTSFFIGLAWGFATIPETELPPGDPVLVTTEVATQESEERSEVATQESKEKCEAPQESSAEIDVPAMAEPRLYNVPLSDDLQKHIISLCAEKQIDPAIIFAMIYRESTFDPNAIGDDGKSYGLMQIQLRYVRERMERLGCTDLLDPYQNVTVGIDLLAEYIAREKGIEWALMAYNGGEAYANNNAAQGYISSYVIAVLSKAEEIGGDMK